MGINRPSNLNIRDVPGNGSIVGPSTSPTCVESTTVCETCFNTCGSSTLSFDSTVLGCQCTFCKCPCCDIVCGCDCTVCNRTIPSGMWKPSEQYEAKGRDAWGDNTSSSGSQSCLCNINSGFTCGAINAPVGGYIMCVASSVAWVVAPSSTEVTRNWHSRNDATTTAQAAAACGDWFIPVYQQLQNPGYTCRTYWDNVAGRYWSNTDRNNGYAWNVDLANGSALTSHYGQGQKNSGKCVRAFRCVTY